MVKGMQQGGKGRPKGTPRSEAEIAADAMRTGRPTLAADAGVSKAVTMRLAPADYKQFVKDAKRAKMGLAAFMRDCWRRARGGK